MYVTRKILSVFTLLLLTLSTTGCTLHIENNFGNVEKRFTLKLYNDCKDDIYGYHVEYYLDEKPIGGTVGQNADESEISGKYALQLAFYESYFPEGADLSKFQFEISVLDGEMRESEFTEVVELAAEYGKSYDIRVNGSFDEGFSAERG